MNLITLRSRLRSYIRGRDDQQPFSDGELDLFINEGLQEVAERTEALVRDYETTVFEGIAAVELPENLIGVQIVRWNDTRLTETTQSYLDTLGDHWIKKRGIPTHYYTNTPNAVRFVPIPDEAGKVRIRFVATPRTLEEDTDTSDLPDFLTSLAPMFASYRALVALGDLTQAQVWLTTFEQRLEHSKRALARRTSVPKGIRIKTEVSRRY